MHNTSNKNLVNLESRIHKLKIELNSCFDYLSDTSSDCVFARMKILSWVIHNINSLESLVSEFSELQLAIAHNQITFDVSMEKTSKLLSNIINNLDKKLLDMKKEYEESEDKLV